MGASIYGILLSSRGEISLIALYTSCHHRPDECGHRGRSLPGCGRRSAAALGQLVAGDAAVFHTPVNDIGTKSLEGELGALLGYVFFHKDGEFGGCIGFRVHTMIEFCVTAEAAGIICPCLTRRGFLLGLGGSIKDSPLIYLQIWRN